MEENSLITVVDFYLRRRPSCMVEVKTLQVERTFCDQTSFEDGVYEMSFNYCVYSSLSRLYGYEDSFLPHGHR